MKHGDNKTDKWATASLRIFADTLTVEEITVLLGVPASSSHSKGQPKGSRAPNLFWRDSAWILNSPLPESEELSSHLQWLLDFIEPGIDVVRTLQKTCKVDLFCLFASETGQGSTVLDRSLLARLARVQLDLLIALSPPPSPVGDEEGFT